jgi:diguanylate cyclase (GGDEF)-like protein
MPRRFKFPAIAAALAAGAPSGLLLVKAATAPAADLAGLVSSVRQDPSIFIYVTVSTLAVFSAFGYVMGRQADALEDLSRTDPLTGLGNDRAFDEGLQDEVARAGRYGGPLSLLIADVDGLKAINDRDGHSAGNAALRAVARALADHARQTDLIARIGGDEFALLAPYTEARDALALGERIRLLLAGSSAIDGLTVSIGVATLDPGRPAGELFEAADAALYEAKRQGRNRVTAAASPPPP